MKQAIKAKIIKTTARLFRIIFPFSFLFYLFLFILEQHRPGWILRHCGFENSNFIFGLSIMAMAAVFLVGYYQPKAPKRWLARSWTRALKILFFVVLIIFSSYLVYFEARQLKWLAAVLAFCFGSSILGLIWLTILKKDENKN